ncbi:Bax inhibitor-1/YccA family protein [Lactobacillus delbrueckii]|uniref:Bax inhibitor-1/YccA family protein n=1 Tax=Lactobacillus delbrueckii TaxID=1584 RepID=A0AAW5YXF4_9LACO|nr:Bax inhibitor-1/YccA family protein [Lactobacillus delbrueckii]MCT2878576.1 Bax inhibitor-1/YccA family protein [Lactobacillus delbrueckii]MCT3492319.1 Bax inhibitor-1/YccA family protein [Lactobacillus delbrueckii]MDA3768299.1 Bax inhibitor-1/YccA family protein [Lactobacillus delbrueckii]MDF4030023.1 Bax inhibitor-1/YccA family protein [Lactobacillus delbrueckii]
MFNVSPEQERRHIVDDSALNGFLTKMYSIMGLAVLVSALTAYLTLTVFSGSLLPILTNRVFLWVLLLLPLILSVGISFKATRKPTTAFFMLMAIAVVYGLEFSLLAFAYTGAQIGGAFISASAVFIGMAAYGSVTKKNLDTIGAYASAAIWGLIVASLVNMFLKSTPASFIFSIIGVIIFTILTAWDAQKMKSIYASYGDQLPELGLAVNGALMLYLDFINLFLQFLRIFGIADNDN